MEKGSRARGVYKEAQKPFPKKEWEAAQKLTNRKY